MVNKVTSTKYLAIASAVAVACGGYASASTIERDGSAGSALITVSKQGIATAASTSDQVPGNFTIVLAGAYANADQVTIALSGASFRTSTNTGTPAALLSCGPAAGGSSVILTYLTKDASTVTYRVTGGTSQASGGKCAIDGAGYSVVASSITAGASSVTLSVYANAGGASGTRFDTSTSSNPFAIFGARDQYLAAIGTALSGIVDVAAGRRTWSDANSKTLTLSLTSRADTAAVTAANTSAVINVYGASGTQMFSFLNDGTGSCTADELTLGAGSASATGGSLSISADCATLTWTSNASYVASGVTNPTITLAKATSSTGLAIPDGVFTVGVTFTAAGTTTNSSQAITAFSGGEFTINGTTITVPYMPYGTSGTSVISQSYYIANSSTTAGTVTGVAQNQAGATCQLGTVGTAAAKSVTNLSTSINDKIAACYATGGVFPEGTRVYLELTSNTSANKTVLNSTYNVGGNSRVNVTNNSNRVRTEP